MTAKAGKEPTSTHIHDMIHARMSKRARADISTQTCLAEKHSQHSLIMAENTVEVDRHNLTRADGTQRIWP